MGHINRGYEPVSTEDIHAVCAEPDPAGGSGTNSSEPRPAPRSARKKEAPQPVATPPKSQEISDSSNVKATPVKSARVRHNAPPKPEAE